jgi:hypothetical protein
MAWKIEYPYRDVEQFIRKLPPGLTARYFHLTDLIITSGSNLGMPHTKAMATGIFELRIKGKEGIARSSIAPWSESTLLCFTVL